MRTETRHRDLFVLQCLCRGDRDEAANTPTKQQLLLACGDATTALLHRPFEILY